MSRRALRALPLVVLAAAQAAPDGEPVLRPGRETRVERDAFGGHVVVYVPTDYRASRSWPAIFCYHGQNGKPTAWPFRQVTGGRGFVIVGMRYLPDPGRLRPDEFRAHVAREVALMQRVDAYVAGRLRTDPRRRIIGGFSKGGWFSSLLGEAAASRWAAICILGAGRHDRDRPLRNPRLVRGKPIYIGVGQNDPNNPHARLGRDFYRTAGARVTFEEFPRLGHQMNVGSKALRDWLLGIAYLADAPARLAAARQAEKAGRLGEAYAIYRELAQLSDAHAACVAAAKAAEPLRQRADTLLAEAARAIDAGRHADAATALLKLAAAYQGSPFADRAKQRLDALPADDAVRQALQRARTDAEADALEAQAIAAQQAGKHDKAIDLYRQYLARFPDATRAQQVRTACSALYQEQARRRCRVWLNLAENFLRAGNAARARAYLQRILNTYGDTPFAAAARERLAKLDGRPAN